MKTPTYKKTVEGKLEIKKTVEEVEQVSLEELIADRDYIATQMGFYQDRIDEFNALIAKAREMGVVEKVEVVEEVVDLPVEDLK